MSGALKVDMHVMNLPKERKKNNIKAFQGNPLIVLDSNKMCCALSFIGFTQKKMGLQYQIKKEKKKQLCMDG